MWARLRVFVQDRFFPIGDFGLHEWLVPKISLPGLWGSWRVFSFLDFWPIVLDDEVYQCVKFGVYLRTLILTRF